MDKSQKQFAIPKDQIRRLLPQMGGCFATDKITVDGKKIGYMYRESPGFEQDSGWRFFAGDESQEYLDNAWHTGIYEVNTIANYDLDIISYLDTSAPCAFEKVAGTHIYRAVEPPDEGKA